MVYAVEDLRNAVRANVRLDVGESVFPNEDLDLVLLLGKRRLDADRANIVESQIVQGSAYYQATTMLTGWIDGFSSISWVYSPVPDVALVQAPIPMHFQSFTTQRISGIEYMVFLEGALPQSALIGYTVPWQVRGLNGSTVTTIAVRYLNALEIACTAFTALALALKSAATVDEEIPAERVNHGNRSSQYQRIHDKYIKLYENELRQVIGEQGQVLPPAIMVRGSYEPRRSDGSDYLTHRTRMLV
jgi:hypothetical protein